MAEVTVAAGVEVKEAIGLVEELEAGQGGVGTEVAIGHQDVARAEGGPQVVKQGIFTDGVRGGGLLQEGPGFEAENAHQTHQRKTAARGLVLGLGAKLTVGGRVGEIEAGAVENLEGTLARDAGQECVRVESGAPGQSAADVN